MAAAILCSFWSFLSVGFWGSAPHPDGGAYSAPPYPLAGWEGCPPPAPSSAPTIISFQHHCNSVPTEIVEMPVVLVQGSAPSILAICSPFLSFTEILRGLSNLTGMSSLPHECTIAFAAISPCQQNQLPQSKCHYQQDCVRLWRLYQLKLQYEPN